MDIDYDGAGPSARSYQQASYDTPRNANEARSQHPTEAHFEVFAWYPHYQRCLRYFLDQAQHTLQVQTLASFININLPCQKRPPIISSKQQGQISPSLPLGMGMPPQMGQPGSPFPSANTHGPPPPISLLPYVRRLVATGFDTPNIMHGFFGDDWHEGVGEMREMERRNYLFATKSGSWLEVKTEYDVSPYETVPFLKPLQHATEEELSSAEKSWSDWLAMQDWMVGPRAPDSIEQSARTRSPQIKREPRD